MMVAFLEDGTSHQILLDRNTILGLLHYINKSGGVKINEPNMGIELDLEKLHPDMRLDINLDITDNTKTEENEN